jgi:hypothetical protein
MAQETQREHWDQQAPIYASDQGHRRFGGICPLFDFLPTQAHVSILDDAHVFETMLELSKRYAEHPPMVALSGRLLIVAQKQ